MAKVWAWRNGRATSINAFHKLEWTGSSINPEGCFEVYEDGGSIITYNIIHDYTGWHYRSKFLTYYEPLLLPSKIWRQLDKTSQNH